MKFKYKCRIEFLLHQLAVLLISFFVVCFGSCCTFDGNYVDQIIEFNNISNFNAVPFNDCDIVKFAMRKQVTEDYLGIDDWFSVSVDSGSQVLCGIPGQSWFYTIKDTYLGCNGNKKKFWELLQVKNFPENNYDSVGFFTLRKPVYVAISKVQANKSYGNGGAWQIFIKNYSSVLRKDSVVALRKDD